MRSKIISATGVKIAADGGRSRIYELLRNYNDTHRAIRPHSILSRGVQNRILKNKNKNKNKNNQV